MFNSSIEREGGSRWPRGLRRGSATARFLGLRVRILSGEYMSVCCECCVCQVEVSATGWSLVQRSATECGVSECDREASVRMLGHLELSGYEHTNWDSELQNIVEVWKTNLMSLAILFHLLCAQHVSDINISIIRSLRLCWWITTSVVLFCKDGCFSN